MLVAPVLSIGLLAGMNVEHGGYVKPQNADAYHRWAQSAIGLQTGKDTDPQGSVPHIIGDWTGEEVEIPTAAQQLLRPNAILSRLYRDNSANKNRLRIASLLIVQCADPRDMLGHYPPVCYKAFGETLAFEQPRQWNVRGLKIDGMEYEFNRVVPGRKMTRVVYNFIVVPGKSIVRDMESLGKASEFYQQRYFGAAQIQVVVPVDASNNERTDADREADRKDLDRVFAELISPNVWIIETLLRPERVKP